MLGDHFSIANWVGGLLIFLFVVVFSYWGREAIEKSMMLSIVALFCVLAVLVVQLFSGHANTVANAFATEPYKAGAVMNGLKYAIGGWWLYPNITVLRHRAAHPASRLSLQELWLHFSQSFLPPSFILPLWPATPR